MKRKLKCLLSIHGPLVYGVGGMGDGIICLACGREAYEENWWPGTRFRAFDLNKATLSELKEIWWPKIEAARNLPNGVNNAPTDFEFESWLRSKPDCFNPDWKGEKKS